MAGFDIFNPQKTTIAKGLEGKSFLIYGDNSLGKTAQAVRMKKPFVIASESGLNATVNVPYARVTAWNEVKSLIRQFTSPATVEKAREMYSTIIVDEVYAASLLCQDYCIATYGDGALTLGDSPGKVNLYQMYEKEFFKAINSLLSASYTVVFIAHAQEKDGYITPKGDKRCIDPIRDFVDYVIYLQSNGVDENNNVIPSSAYLARTDKFFARSRWTTTPTYLPVWSVEALEEAVNIGISKMEEENGVNAVTFEEQQANADPGKLSFEEVMNELKAMCDRFIATENDDAYIEIVEDVLGSGGQVSKCTKKQIQALNIILDNLQEKAAELNI